MTPVSESYAWEVELVDHRVLRQYEEDGRENPSTTIPPGEVVRASIVPRTPLRPRHDVLLDHAKGERFVRRFGRGLMRDSGEGVKLAEYLQCVVTTHYRLWVFSSSGRALVSPPDFELYP
jgi:hypothetical protein